MKKLIFCFDGTSNDPEDAADFFDDSSISNILKLHIFLGGKLNPKNEKNDATPNQHSFYYSGVGTRGNWFLRILNAMFAPRSGDIENIIEEAKKDLDKFHSEGDKVYIFGFSRGAAIARIFAARHCGDRNVSFLGVFDTVAAIKAGLGHFSDVRPASDVFFENGSLSDHIEKALHLLAIDEKRIVFRPTLFNADEKVNEVWFAGVHSDIGGGYWFDGLSDITLRFMINEIKKEGLIVLDEEAEDKINDADIKIEGSEDTICMDDLNINPLKEGALHEQKRFGIAKKTLAPRLICVNEDDIASKSKIPIIHHTVCERFNEVTSYRPYALRGRKFRIMDENGTVGEKIYEGIQGMDEFSKSQGHNSH